METPQKTVGSTDSVKQDFAAVRCVAGLFRLRAARDPQRIAALRKHREFAPTPTFEASVKLQRLIDDSPHWRHQPDRE